MVGWLGWGLVARARRARRRRIEAEHNIGARLATWGARRCPVPRPAPTDLRRAWRAASEAERVAFLAEIEDVPY